MESSLIVMYRAYQQYIYNVTFSKGYIMKTKKKCPVCGEPMERLYRRLSFGKLLTWGFYCFGSGCHSIFYDGKSNIIPSEENRIKIEYVESHTG